MEGHEGGKIQYRDTCRKCGARRVDRQIGLEPTIDEYVQKMVAVFREVRRVLHPSGTLWLELGSTYVSSKMESDEMVLRDDLTPEELSHVYTELAGLFTSKAMSEVRDSNTEGKPSV